MFSQIFHAYGFSFLHGQASFRHQFHTRSNQNFVFQLTGNFLGQILKESIVIGKSFNSTSTVILIVRIKVGQRNEVLITQFLELQQDVLNLNRKILHP